MRNGSASSSPFTATALIAMFVVIAATATAVHRAAISVATSRATFAAVTTSSAQARAPMTRMNSSPPRSSAQPYVAMSSGGRSTKYGP